MPWLYMLSKKMVTYNPLTLNKYNLIYLYIVHQVAVIITLTLQNTCSKWIQDILLDGSRSKMTCSPVLQTIRRYKICCGFKGSFRLKYINLNSLNA